MNKTRIVYAFYFSCVVTATCLLFVSIFSADVFSISLLNNNFFENNYYIFAVFIMSFFLALILYEKLSNVLALLRKKNINDSNKIILNQIKIALIGLVLVVLLMLFLVISH